MNDVTITSATRGSDLDSRARAIAERLGSVPTTASDGAAFLKARVLLFIQLAGALWTGSWLLERAVCLVVGGEVWDHGSTLANRFHVGLHIGIGIALLALAPLVRRMTLGAFALARLENVLTLAQIFLFCVMLRHAPVGLRPDLAMLLAAGHILVLRAALVPATPRSTAALGVLANAIVAVTCYDIFHDAPAGTPFAGKVAIPIVDTLIWGSIAIVGTTAVSFVIYGLRKRVEQAIELGQYTLLEKLGEGGMGVVYRARHALLRRPTAVKVLRSTGDTPTSIPCKVLGCRPLHGGDETAQRAPDATLERFEREVQLTAEISHPNVVSVYDFGRSPDGAFYYAMEFLDGVDLQRLVDEHGPMPPSRVVHVLRQIAEALAEAHAVGLIHRDIKPANVILCEHARRFDHVKVVDFGLVKDLTAPASGVSEARMVTGTPLYMSPEAITKPLDVDARSDLYALGAVGYFLLTGEPVFDGKTVVEVCGAHLHKPVVRPSLRSGTPIPAALEDLVMRLLAKKRDERPGSAEEVVSALVAIGTTPWTADEARGWWQDRKRGAPSHLAKPQSGTRTRPHAARVRQSAETLDAVADVNRA